MVEIRGDKKVLVTPVSAEDLKDIKIGDIVWLDGDLMTCRDVAHRRLVEESFLMILRTRQYSMQVLS